MSLEWTRQVSGRRARTVALASICMLSSFTSQCATNVHLTGVPDYEWFAGCFGTATGNLMGFWDRHGFPNFYGGPTGYGLAPLNSFGMNYGIRALWVTQAGLDGRPESEPGHVDDYYFAFASTVPDPYLTSGRTEHKRDCLGDFIGLNQNKWRNLNGECDGNIDGYSFVYWEYSGERRVNFAPGPEAGLPASDIQSGLREWTRYRGATADVFTQLSDFNPETPSGNGFTFEDLKTEIDAGYPVLMFLQDSQMKSHPAPGMDKANPWIHAMLAYGYFIADDGTQHVRLRDSYAGGDAIFRKWSQASWWGDRLPLRGVIGYHPYPQIMEVSETHGQLTFRWTGPNSERYEVETGAVMKPHWYVLETTTSLMDPDFAAVGPATTNNFLTIPAPETQPAYFRIKLVGPPPESSSTLESLEE